MEKKNQIHESVRLTINCLKDYYGPKEYKQLGSYCLSQYANMELENRRGFAKDPFCPMCNGQNIIRYGKQRGVQKYYCKDCKKVFTGNSHTMMERTQIDNSTWLNIIGYILKNNATLEELVSLCGISRTTAFYARLRIIYAIELLNEDVLLSGEMQADELFIPFNAKGQCFDSIERKPRKRGGSNTKKNQNENSICVVVAVERDYIENQIKIVSRVAGFGQASKMRIYRALSNKIVPKEDSVLITDGSRAYSLLAEKSGLEWKRLITQTKGKKRVPGNNGRYNIQLINAYHSKLRTYLRKSRGISSKYLPAHLQIFDFAINYSQLNREEQAFLILTKLLDCHHHLTQKELTRRYYLPSYRKQIAENWRKHFPKEDVRIYRAIQKGVPKKEIIAKYGTSYKRMRTIVKKIDSLKAEIETAKEAAKKEKQIKEISDLDWQIYTLYKTGDYTYKALAKKFGLSIGGVGKKVKRIDARPEGYEGKKKLRWVERHAAEKHKQSVLRKNKIKKRHDQIYLEFHLLCAGNSRMSLEDAYRFLGKKYHLSKYTVRNLVFARRKKDASAVWRKKGKGVRPDFQHKTMQS